MITRQTIHQKRDAILAVAARHGAHDIRVFGSVARGDTTESSDLDLIVRLDPDRSLFDLGGLVMDLRDLLGIKVDIISEGSLYGRFGQIVSKEAIPL
jgi:hypothetical protein